jgi:ribonucleoside-diphosphate reductase alpha chain
MQKNDNILFKNSSPEKGVFFTSESPVDNLSTQQKDKNKGLRVERHFSKEGAHPYTQMEWEYRTAQIKSAKGEIIFEQKNVETPVRWSQTAVDIVAEKYFSGHIGKSERETSVKQLIDRVADSITSWGLSSGYFATQKDSVIFNEELKHLLVLQKGSFNSPVWFNVGVEKRPQCSACFILSINDSKESIAEWYRDEMFIFSGGSGSGINLSPLRSSKESISKRGKSSGPVSFMKGADAIAGTIRSGGKTRRAAKMVILNVDHPDVKDFIVSKWKEEEKAKALIEAGYDDAIDGEVYSNIFFQNANNSVRASDAFMKAVVDDTLWDLKAVQTGEVTETMPARELMYSIAESAWHCADPGMQFDTTINRWHTCPNTGRINASNPCSEYMHIDNSACNLASLNLLSFLNKDGSFDTQSYRSAIRIFIIAQDIIVGHSSYPTEKIGTNADAYRQLGLGYTNLGALLMRWGYSYDSDVARANTAAITSILTGDAYATSAEIATVKGSFNGYENNKEPMLEVIRMHGEEAERIDKPDVRPELWDASQGCWKVAYDQGVLNGVRNSQATVLAPTGTISFMMDADTTGIEPAFSLIAYKKMVGGGFLKMVNRSVEPALHNLGYSDVEVKEVMDYVLTNDTIEGAPHIKEEHLSVFDCATHAANGDRAIHYMGHVRMMAAAQPFISGAISKTVNLPESVSIDDIMNAYMEAWKLGLKAIAVYRDNSKGAQPLNTSKTKGSKNDVAETDSAGYYRRKLPADVRSIRHKFSIAGHEGYIHCGLYEDGSLGEVFIRMAKEGSTIAGLLDGVGILLSISLQSGVPVRMIIRKFVHSRFEPAGYTENSDIMIAKSILDYIARYLAIQFLSPEDRMDFGVYTATDVDEAHPVEPETPKEPAVEVLTEPPKLSDVKIKAKSAFSDAPACRCGAIMIRTGSCYTCSACGENLGSCS